MGRRSDSAPAGARLQSWAAKRQHTVFKRGSRAFAPRGAKQFVETVAPEFDLPIPTQNVAVQRRSFRAVSAIQALKLFARVSAFGARTAWPAEASSSIKRPDALFARACACAWRRSMATSFTGFSSFMNQEMMSVARFQGRDMNWFVIIVFVKQVRIRKEARPHLLDAPHLSALFDRSG
jgi:hypothetical protein